MKNCIFTWILAITGIILPLVSRATVQVYPFTQGAIPVSDQYRVEVSQGGKTYPIGVYMSLAQVPQYNKSKTTSFALLAFDGALEVRITKLKGTFSKARVLPTSKGVKHRKVNANTLVFTLNKPMYLSIELDDSIEHPLLFLADSPEINPPSASDQNVWYFPPGYHRHPTPLEPKTGTHIYLAPGAIVEGLIKGHNTPNVTISGRGILLGRSLGHTGGRHIYFSGEGSKNIRVEGITILDSPGFYVTTQGDSTHIRHVKGMGWWFNTDGFSTGKNGLIEDCFLKCNDDAVKLYQSGTKVYRTTIWQMENGAPFQLSWNMNSDNRGFEVRDCDVIRVDHDWDNTNTAVFAAIHGGSGHMQDYLFEDIRVENTNWRLLSLQIRPNQFANSQELGRLSNIRFKNIQVTTTDGLPLRRINLLQGWDRDHRISDVSFDNIRVNGQRIDHARAGRFQFDSVTTANIRFGLTTTPPTKKHTSTPLKTWQNPIKNGLNSYGQKDFFLFEETGRWYLVATEQPNPEWGKRGIILYSSPDMVHWQEESYLMHRQSIDSMAWYRDDWTAPEIHRIKGKYYLSFTSNNNQTNPYGRQGLGLAVADALHGPYRVITRDSAIRYGNHFTLSEHSDGQVYACWDDVGRIYAAPIHLETGVLTASPSEILNREVLQNQYRFLDAPNITATPDGQYLLTYSQFYGGYVIRVRYAYASHPLGPWRPAIDEPLLTFTEDEAPDVLQMPYGKETSFAPPTQVIFSHQLVKTPKNGWLMVYHSSEKYAEPYLCVEPVRVTLQDLAPRIEMINAKSKTQKIIQP